MGDWRLCFHGLAIGIAEAPRSRPVPHCVEDPERNRAESGLVGVYLSRDAAVASVIGAAIPWAAGLAVVSLLVLPLAIGLIYRSSTESQVRTDEALKAEHEARREARKLEQELLRFRAALEQAREAIVIFDVANGKILDVNDTACRLLKPSRRTSSRTAACSWSGSTMRDIAATPSGAALWHQTA